MPGEGGGGGKGRLKTFYTGRLRPKVRPLTPLHAIIDRKGSPFV